MGIDSLAFPSVLVRGGCVVDGTPALAQLLDEAGLRWRVAAGPSWSSEFPPWRADEAWAGEVEAKSSSDTRRFLCGGVHTPDGLLWQFVEESTIGRQHRMIAEAVDALPDAFSITTSTLDRPGPQFVFVNRAFTQLMGWAEDEILGQTPRVLQGAKTDRAELDRLVSCLTAGRSFRGGAINYLTDPLISAV